MADQRLGDGRGLVVERRRGRGELAEVGQRAAALGLHLNLVAVRLERHHDRLDRPAQRRRVHGSVEHSRKRGARGIQNSSKNSVSKTDLCRT